MCTCKCSGYVIPGNLMTLVHLSPVSVSGKLPLYLAVFRHGRNYHSLTNRKVSIISLPTPRMDFLQRMIL
ncbi:UNVERIFIED_CONTAM: hypothetical protein FKN15_072675 [Acipenser sinensis]